jgi:hypothetical protein
VSAQGNARFRCLGVNKSATKTGAIIGRGHVFAAFHHPHPRGIWPLPGRNSATGYAVGNVRKCFESGDIVRKIRCFGAR